MDGAPARLTIHRHAGENAEWESVLGLPDPRLAGIVDGAYQGWTERTSTIRRRREVAKVIVPLIINFGPRFGVHSPGNPSGKMERFDSFVAGLHDGPAITEAETFSCCIQANLTPIGAHRLLGLPLAQLANRTVGLADLDPVFDRLRDRLFETAGWRRRFDLLDRFLLGRVAAGPAPDARVSHVLRAIDRSAGGASIGHLADAVGLSRKRLVGLFHEQVGAPPKTVARLVRFDRAVSLLTGSRDLAAVALDCGYFDQAHFNRDFRAFSGVSPTAFLKAALPGGAGVAGD